MASGAEHYREAERLLGEQAKAIASTRRFTGAIEGYAEAAQTHALLALAAATALHGDKDAWRAREAWYDALGIDPNDEGEDC